MFREVIVGVDGKPNSRDAVLLAAKLVGERGRITLANVHDDHTLVGADISDIARDEALALLARERDAAELDADLVAVGARSVGHGLHEIAERREADLLVVGSCSRGALGRLLLGDDRRASLDGAPCAVAIAPAGYARRPRPIAKIGVAYDDSPESEQALALARDVASQHRSALVALTVVSIPSYSYGVTRAIDWTEVIDGMVNEARERLAHLDGVDGRVIRGVAVEELAAWSGAVDLLVVGSRGYGPVRRVVFGSTSEFLARSTSCPLLVLRRGVAANAIATADAIHAAAGR
jgi:nucleotide-binding universal stress UspA family protein